MTSYAGAARHLLLLTAIGCTSNTSTSLVAAESDPSGSVWRGDLDWTELSSKLSPSASLIDTSFINYRDECVPEFYEESPTNHALIDQQSGMCLNHLLLGWEADVGWQHGMQLKPLDTVMGFEGDDTTPSPIAGDESNLRLNLPFKVVIPSVASDVVHIVRFAKKHNIEISVKNSGHSYSGASSKKDTLLVNMNRYTHYASGGITDCDPARLGTAVADDLSNQACLLALARDKPGLIRVGGGENFDKAYRAVVDFNKALPEYKYHMVGGAAGTVSPMGWTFQGGNAGTMGGRRYGATSRDGAAKWPSCQVWPYGMGGRKCRGFRCTSKKVVSGVCRSNPDEQDEEKWIWGVCPEDFGVDFGDLWFAVNGGGGGTWGVVTSLSLQLHDYLPFNWFRFVLGFDGCEPILPKFQEFRAKYFMAPSLLNVTKERSLACGSPNCAPSLFCYGEEDVMRAWTDFLELNNSTEYAPCLQHEIDSSSEEPLLSYPDFGLVGGLSGRFPGKIPDYPLPSLIGEGPGSANVLIPQSWLDESEENIDILLNYSSGYSICSPYYAYGVATSSFSDQANSLPQTLRDAATMSARLWDNNDFWSDLFPKMYDISDKTKFPAVFQSNHAGISALGPLKDDWTKACPLEWTIEERNEKCISAQEAIYGTELLRRLEAIKMAVDPGFMLNCTDCIGNNLDLVNAPEVPLDEPSVAVDEPSGASFASTCAAAISATVLSLCLSLF